MTPEHPVDEIMEDFVRLLLAKNPLTVQTMLGRHGPLRMTCILSLCQPMKVMGRWT